MSCYLLTPTDPDRLIVRVGWDSSVQSFFVYISRPAFRKSGVVNEDAGGVVKSRGMGKTDLITIEELEREIEGYGIMTDTVRDALLADQQRSAAEVVRTRGAA